MSLQYSTTLFIYQPGLFPKSTVNSVTTLTRAGALTFEDHAWSTIFATNPPSRGKLKFFSPLFFHLRSPFVMTVLLVIKEQLLIFLFEWAW